jgi:PPOX class probable F420-dependent enzyme
VNEGEARRRFGAAGSGHLASVRPNGTPHVVPFVFVLRGDTIHWVVDRKPKRTARIARLDNIEANPSVEAVVDHYEDRWSSLWWVRASGRARVVSDPAERTTALSALAAKYPQYQRAAPDGPVVAIDVGVWTWWSGGSDGRGRAIASGG